MQRVHEYRRKADELMHEAVRQEAWEERSRFVLQAAAYAAMAREREEAVTGAPSQTREPAKA